MKKVNESIVHAIEILKAGGVIAHPADTCFGLLGDFKNPEALKKIQAIKGRDAIKPMSVMFPLSMKAHLEDFVVLDTFARQVCEKLLPGAVTIVLPKNKGVPAHYFPEVATLGIRIPDDKATQEILEAFGGPLITTSANLSGQGLTYTNEEVEDAFKDAEVAPDLILEGRVKEGPASTVIAIQNGEIKILREGPVTEQDLEKLFPR
jgi:L-threonylcarbamoyladenylate synthase